MTIQLDEHIYTNFVDISRELKLLMDQSPIEWFTLDQLDSKFPDSVNLAQNLQKLVLDEDVYVTDCQFRWNRVSCDILSISSTCTGKQARRQCNSCATLNSRYWRSDLEEKNGWLCNNCGMNQRRGRGISRTALKNSSLDCSVDSIKIDVDYVNILDDTNKVAECKKRRCGYCHTFKSAGKWRRDLEVQGRYLCNKCGMNQRRAQLKREREYQGEKAALNLNTNHLELRRTRSQKIEKYEACDICEEKIPTFSTLCLHHICGECIPSIIRNCYDKVNCPICVDSQSISVVTLGRYIDSLIEV